MVSLVLYFLSNLNSTINPTLIIAGLIGRIVPHRSVRLSDCAIMENLSKFAIPLTIFKPMLDWVS